MTIASNTAEPPPTELPFASDVARLASFARGVDELRRDTEAKLGRDDVDYIGAVRTISSIMEVTGRTLIHVSLEPISFGIGVIVLASHKALELMEIGHTTLHGTYDRLPGGEAFLSGSFRWKAPIDEKSWRQAHNVRHHQNTNIVGRDPDLDFGGLRLSARVPFQPVHALQPLSNLFTWLGFATAINLHVTGVIEVYAARQPPVQLEDRRPRTLVRAHARFLRKSVAYYTREFVFFPLLGGPFFAKILLGNLLSEVARDLYAAATIYCGHVGASDFPAGTRTTGRAAFYAAQVETACNIEVPRLLSILAGGLDHQIEHHLFPRLPPNRLREIAPRLRALCAQHGLPYHSSRWPKRLREVLRSLTGLRREVSIEDPVRSA